MRLAYCCDVDFPSRAAHAEQIVGMCDAFSRSGAEVILLARSFKQRPEELFSYYGVKDPFKCAAVSSTYYRSKRIHGLRIACKLMQVRPDLVYCRCLYSAFFSALFGFPTVYEAHTPPRAGAVLTRAMLRILFALEKLKLVVAISENVKSDLLEITKAKPGKIVVLPTGGAESSSQAKVELSGDFRIAYAGSFYQGKGLEMIVAIAKATPDINFHIAGETSQVNYLDKLPTNIHLHGHLPPSRIPSFLKAAHCLIAPCSQSMLDCSGREISRWSSPLKIFQYMAANRPIIAGDLPGVREVLSNERAIILDDNQVVKWIEAIQYAREHLPELHILARKAHEKFLRDYSWSRRVEKILRLLGLQEDLQPALKKVVSL